MAEAALKAVRAAIDETVMLLTPYLSIAIETPAQGRGGCSRVNSLGDGCAQATVAAKAMATVAAARAKQKRPVRGICHRLATAHAANMECNPTQWPLKPRVVV